MYNIKVNLNNIKVTSTDELDLSGFCFRLLIVLHEKGYNATACEERGKISVMISKASLQNIINEQFNPDIVSVK